MKKERERGKERGVVEDAVENEGQWRLLEEGREGGREGLMDGGK